MDIFLEEPHFYFVPLQCQLAQLDRGSLKESICDVRILRVYEGIAKKQQRTSSSISERQDRL
jgi:hypothetical protein